MAVLNLSLDAFNMDPEAVSEAMQTIIKYVEEMEACTDFMTGKIESVNDQFASSNYDRITEALTECKGKLEKTREEFDELLASCKNLIEKINLIES